MRIDALSTVVAVLESGKRPKGGVSGESGTIPSLGGEHLNNDGGFRFDKIKYIDEQFFACLKKGAIKENDILIVKDGATTGKVSFVGSDFPFERAAINEHLFSLTVDTKIANPRYVFSFLKSPQGQKEILKDFRGAAIGGISRGFVDLAQIPLPPLNDQIRIAHLLGKVEGLIGQRKQNLQQLDELLKSVFLEMFGNPVRNEKEWNKQPFSAWLSEIESGKSPKCEARSASDEEWGVLKLGAVTRCVFDANENKALPTETKPTVKHEVKAGDLLFSRKNTYELVAACAYVYETRPRLLMPDLIFRFVFKEDAEVNPIYVWKLLTNDSQRKAIQAFAAGAAGSMPNISKANLKTAQLPVPPIELQNQFATIVEKVEALKSRYQQSLNDLVSLYGALSQQAFKGELDLSQVPMTAIQTEHKQIEAAESWHKSTAENLSNGLPEIGVLLDEVQGPIRQQDILRFWLKAYCRQLGGTSFSLQRFMGLAHARLAELHQDDDFGLSASDYEHIKAWVFEALASGKLKQERNQVYCVIETEETVLGNLVELKAGEQR